MVMLSNQFLLHNYQQVSLYEKFVCEEDYADNYKYYNCQQTGQKYLLNLLAFH
jgi:hypothetical protein